MARRNNKIVVSIPKDEVEALIGNHGAFESCAGFSQELIKVNQCNYSEGWKFYFSKGTCSDILSALNEVMESPRYPNKCSKEYRSVDSFTARLKEQYQKQVGKCLT